MCAPQSMPCTLTVSLAPPPLTARRQRAAQHAGPRSDWARSARHRLRHASADPGKVGVYGRAAQRMDVYLRRMASMTAPRSSFTCARSAPPHHRRPRPSPDGARAAARPLRRGLLGSGGPPGGRGDVCCDARCQAATHGDPSAALELRLGLKGGAPAQAGWRARRPCRGCRPRGTPPWTART